MRNLSGGPEEWPGCFYFERLAVYVWFSWISWIWSRPRKFMLYCCCPGLSELLGFRTNLGFLLTPCQWDKTSISGLLPGQGQRSRAPPPGCCPLLPHPRLPLHWTAQLNDEWMKNIDPRIVKKWSLVGALYLLGSLGFCLGFRGWTFKTADLYDTFFSLNFLHFCLSSSLRSSLTSLLVVGRALPLGGFLVGVALETEHMMSQGLLLVLGDDKKSSSDDWVEVDGDKFFCFNCSPEFLLLLWRKQHNHINKLFCTFDIFAFFLLLLFLD